MGLWQRLMDLVVLEKDKKPDMRQFRARLLEAMADGILTDQEVDDLEAIKEKYRLTDEDIARFGFAAYQVAFRAAFEKGSYSKRKEKELLRIENYLELSDDKRVRRYKQQIRRMQELHEIRSGNLPEIEVPGYSFKKGEVAHWAAQVALIEGIEEPTAAADAPPASAPAKAQASGIRYKKEPLPNGKTASQGKLIATNQRLIYWAEGKTFLLGRELIRRVEFYQDGLHIVADAGKTKWCKLQTKGDIELTAEIITRGLNLLTPRDGA